MPEPSRRPPIVTRVIAVEVGLIVLAWVLARIFDRPLFELIVFDWEGIVAGLLATVPPCVAMVWSTRTSMPPFPQVRRDVERLVVPLFRGASWWDMLLIALLAGVGEELFFRGLLQPGLAGWTGAWTAIILTSALFGVLHWITPAYAALAGLVGLYLGAFMAVSGNLLVPILVHALYDFFALRYLIGRSAAPAEEGERAAGGSAHPEDPTARE
jgi:membrane protease YdiL (CAAX protease family)